MTDELKRIEELYHLALGKPKEERTAFLAEVCGSDEALHRELQSMIEALEKAGGFMELPALEHAARLAGQAGSQLLAGHQLGPYRVGPLLGRGGMGEVYRAVDTRLDRPVALKLLPAEVSGNPDRLHRFIREAKAASSLNHPNIATIHEIGEAEGWHYIAMEYVEGETLEARIRKQSLKLAEILDLGIQAADALETAHKKGIIHRDIKPANLMLTPEGRVKVLDFGLAKRLHLEQSAKDMPASTESYTVSGLILGTVEYMSPEQVLGRDVDQRTDLFSLGVVLYDMVAGRLPFHGASPTETMDQILHAEPAAFARFNHRIPAGLEQIIRKCLEKDRELRYQHASDLCADLKRLKRDMDPDKAAANRVGVLKPNSKPRRIWLWAAMLLLMVLIAAAGFWFFQPGRETLKLPMVPVPLTAYQGIVGQSSISPDGRQVAFMWDGEKRDNVDIYIKQIGSETPRRLTTDPQEDYGPAWSPDGLFIAFLRGFWRYGKSAVMVIPANGGRERQVAENARNVSWHSGGKWLAISQDSPGEPMAIYLLSLETGEKKRLTSPSKGIGGDAEPVFSPDGRHLAFARYFTTAAVSEIFILRLSAKLEPETEPKQLTFWDRMTRCPVWMPDGKEIVFTSGSKAHHCSLWRISASSSDKPTPLPFSGEGGTALSPTVSLENHRLVYAVWSSDFNIWRYQLPRGKEKPAAPSRFSPSTKTQEVPQYSPDGKEVAYVSNASGSSEIWVANSDGSSPLQLTHFGGPMPDYPRWSPDGKKIVFSMALRDQTEIFQIPAQGGQAKQLTHTPYHKFNPSFSRDGKWIYFEWNRGGDAQIWKMPLEGGEPVQITRKGGSLPLESMDGKTLFYKKGADTDELWTIPVVGGEETKVLDGIPVGSFDLTGHSIYYSSETDPRRPKLFCYDFISRKTRFLALIQGKVQAGLTSSADEHWLLLTEGDWLRCNLMLVENFR